MSDKYRIDPELGEYLDRAAARLEAGDAAIVEVERLKIRVKALERLRPHWAQGYSSDSIAAQTTAVALSELWALLGVDNQTAAVAALRNALSVQP